MQINAAQARFGQSASMHRDPEYWRQQARKAWAAADHFHEPRLRETMAQVAVGYEQLADAYKRLVGRLSAPGAQKCRPDQTPAD